MKYDLGVGYKESAGNINIWYRSQWKIYSSWISHTKTIQIIWEEKECCTLTKNACS